MYIFPLLMSQLFNDLPRAKTSAEYKVTTLQDKYEISLPLFGREMSDINIKVEGDTLTIDAAAPSVGAPENARVIWQELVIDDIKLSFRLPHGVNIEGINAQLTAGMLTVSIPKQAPSTRTILVEPAAPALESH
jgi:HSP20 family protein